MLEPTNKRKNLEEIAQMVVNGANMETINKANPLYLIYQNAQPTCRTINKTQNYKERVKTTRTS